MKKLFYTLLLVAFAPFAAISQISQGGTPLSLLQSGHTVNTVPFETMHQIDLDRLIAEDLINDQYKDVPWRFGENIMVNLNPANSGVWDILPKGDRLWRLGISSPGAFTINLTFDKYKLPPGAKLFIYNIDHSEMIGAFTGFNNQDDGYFATTLVQGDAIVIEYYEPLSPLFAGELNLEMVTHSYRDPFKYAKAFGGSGSCNVNVACPQSAGMENQIRSVCMLVSGGNGFCSAALINNTAQDGKAYILSADHCYSNPGSVVFWFNWQSPTCSNPPSSPPYNSMSGATQRSRNSTSDFWLMELNQSIPSSYNVYYSGWNRTMDNYITGKIWGIHHPSGDIKKISWSNLGVSTTAYLQNSVPGSGTHWRITNWSDGTTTEGGSSGSPVYDPAGRIIGQLHGGYASCSSITSDWYGKFGVSWTGGGTNATRLSNWLDPTNSGVITLNGYDPNVISAPPVANFSASTTNPGVGQTVQLIDMSSNAPSSWSWSFTPSTFTYVGGTNSNSKNPQVQFNAGGSYTVTLTATNAYGSGTETKVNYINVIDCTISTFPYTQGFENGGAIPTCWTQEFVSGTQNWTYQNGGQSGNPASAHSGSYNAFLYINSTTARVTKLITPVMNLSGLTNPVLTFWHTQAFWSPDQDELRIYYKNSAGGSWVLLQAYTTSITTWTQRTIGLPNPSGTYYIAFEGTAKYGYGVCLDDVTINGTTVQPPVANFTANNTTPAIGQTVTFTDQSTNSPTSWNWSFSPSSVVYVGGTNATSQHPQVQFTTGGNYSVTLVATNAGGSGQTTKTNYISVQYPPVADFDADDNEPQIGQTVYFWDLSLNNPTSWLWTYDPNTVVFVNNTTGLSQNPEVQFTSGGSYSVTLTATNASGSDAITKSNFINVPYPPVADFIATATTPFAGETVTITDLTSNDPFLWSWSFVPGTVTYVDGTTSVSQNPKVKFDTGGLYTVTLTATGPGGTDSETKTDYIQAINPVIEINLSVYLEGPFNGSGMNAQLGNLIPLSQPYHVTPWNYSGTENVAVIPSNVVDWVLVELRDAASAATATSATIIDRQAAFLLTDGSVVGIDGSSNLTFPNSITQQLFVVVWHRNHLGIMSANAVTPSGGIHTYDFTTGSATVHGGANGHKQLATGIWGMVSGDGNRDGQVGTGDKSGMWDSEAGTAGYIFSDYNLDRQSNNIDKDSYWVPNIGKGSQVPN